MSCGEDQAALAATTCGAAAHLRPSPGDVGKVQPSMSLTPWPRRSTFQSSADVRRRAGASASGRNGALLPALHLPRRVTLETACSLVSAGE